MIRTLPSFRAIALAFPGRHLFLALLGLALLLLAFAGCSLVRPGGDQSPLQMGGPEYSALMISSDLARGPNRLAFALVTRDNLPIGASTATVTPIYTPPGGSEPKFRPAVIARFTPWPPEGSGRGAFVAEVEFDVAGDATRDNPGLWELQIVAESSEGATVETRTAVRVAPVPSTPAIGDPAPRSVTPRADQVPDLSHISSDPNPDPELYALSVHEALEEGKPLMALFSTPAFCVSATCGPQLEVMRQLKEQYGDRANFIHVEVFEDPHLIGGNRFAAQQVPAVAEWGLPTEPWTFIVDGEGLIHAKFEQFTPSEVLEASLLETF